MSTYLLNECDRPPINSKVVYFFANDLPKKLIEGNKTEVQKLYETQGPQVPPSEPRCGDKDFLKSSCDSADVGVSAGGSQRAPWSVWRGSSRVLQCILQPTSPGAKGTLTQK